MAFHLLVSSEMMVACLRAVISSRVMERRGAGREADSVRPEQEAGGGGWVGGLAGGRLAWGLGHGSGPRGWRAVA